MHGGWKVMQRGFASMEIWDLIPWELLISKLKYVIPTITVTQKSFN
jgi:hypothetical protein